MTRIWVVSVFLCALGCVGCDFGHVEGGTFVDDEWQPLGFANKVIDDTRPTIPPLPPPQTQRGGWSAMAFGEDGLQIGCEYQASETPLSIRIGICGGGCSFTACQRSIAPQSATLPRSRPKYVEAF